MSGFHLPGFPALTNKVSMREIEKLVDAIAIAPARRYRTASYEQITVAAVQLVIRQYESLAEYVHDMNAYVQNAVDKNVQLVCFPAYTGMLPAFTFPHYSAMLSRLNPPAKSGLPDIPQLRDCLSSISDYCFNAYFNTMSLLAQRHGVYIMAGSALYFVKDELCHRAFLFNDAGDLVGYQDKISVNALEQELRIVPAAELRLFETPIGQFSILTGEDVNYYEPARVAKNMGAQILLCPAAFTKERTPVDLAYGLNMRVQENALFAVQSVLVGDTGFGITAEGASCIFAPNAMLVRKNGICAQSSGRFEREIISGCLNYDKLSMLITPHIQDQNRAFLQKYIDRLY